MTILQDIVQRLALHDRHLEYGAKFGIFGGWEVPIYYQSILEEHNAVRSRAGLFDISHMGIFSMTGPGACDFLDRILPRNICSMLTGRALYMPLLNDRGTIIDDIILYRVAADNFLLVVNAGNTQKDFDWISRGVPQNLDFRNLTDEMGLISLQGPLSKAILGRIVPEEFTRLSYYRFQQFRSRGIIARTGYTGEYGFEILAERADLGGLWDCLMEAGHSDGLLPVGFGARDTLRLEAGMPLYGHDLSEEVTPLEAGLERTVDWGKSFFTGKEALERLRDCGSLKRLRGLVMLDRGIPREGYVVRFSGKDAGRVTSGTFAPTLQRNIALAYLSSEVRESDRVDVLIRSQEAKAEVVPLPFYRSNTKNR